MTSCTDAAKRVTTVWTSQSTSARLPPPLALEIELDHPVPAELPTFLLKGTTLPVYVAFRHEKEGDVLGFGLNPRDASMAASLIACARIAS